MRICILIFCLIYSNFLLGQTPFEYESDQSNSLQIVLDELSEQYNIQFAFPSEIASDISIPGNKIQANSLSMFISELLENADLEFSCIGQEKVLLRKKRTAAPNDSEITFHGYIHDETTSLVVSHGTVYLSDMSKGTFIDEDGKFELTILESEKKKSVIVSFLGYEERFIDLQNFENGSTISLKQQSFEIGQVVISHTLPRIKSDLYDFSIQLNSKTFSDNKATFLGGSDVMKAVQHLPGISGDDDSSSDIKIRGSNADETMLLLDGMPIYNADHYYGVFSSMNASFIEEVKLYKNVFPIQHTGATAGLLQLESVQDINKFRGAINLNFLNASIALQSPVSDKVGISIAGRTSLFDVTRFNLIPTPDEFNLSDIEDKLSNSEKYRKANPDFKFYDLNAKLKANLSAKTSLSLSFFNSGDDYNNVYTSEFETRSSNNSTRTITEDYRFSQDWQNVAAGAALSVDFSDNFSMLVNTHFSNYKEQSDLFNSIVISDNNSDSNGNVATASINELKDIGLSTSFVSGKKNKLTYGFSVNHYETENSLMNDTTNSRSIAHRSDHATLFGSYSFSVQKLKIEIGSRGTFYKWEDYNDFFLSPQLMASYSFNNVHALKFSLGRNYQFMRQINYENRVGQFMTIYELANDNLIKAGISDNLMVGYQFKKGKWLMDVELFAKNMDGVMELTNIDSGFSSDSNPGQQQSSEYRLFAGTGSAIGLDFLINYQAKNYQSWIAYTLSKTLNKIDQLYRNQAYPNQNDRRHQLKWINNFQLKRFNFSCNTIFSSGKPYIANVTFENTRKSENDPTVVYKPLPYYGRIDLGVSYNFQLFKQAASIGCSVFNVTNRQNVKFNQQTYSIKKQGNDQGDFSMVIGTESALIDRTIDINLNLKF